MCTSRSRPFLAEGTAGCRSCRNPPPSVEPRGAGIAPALLLVLIRRGMVVPERFPGGARVATRAGRPGPDHHRRGPGVPALCTAATVQQRAALQHARRPALRAWHIAGDLDDRDLVADD